MQVTLLGSAPEATVREALRRLRPEQVFAQASSVCAQVARELQIPTWTVHVSTWGGVPHLEKVLCAKAQTIVVFGPVSEYVRRLDAEGAHIVYTVP